MKTRRRLVSKLIVTGAWTTLALGSSGCATYQTKVEEARSHISSRQTARAVEVLAPLAEKEGDDQLVYLLDYAIALQQDGKYQESSKVLNRAERIADILDYTSLSKETASLILSEEMVQYKGDDYEKIMINAVNAINYLMVGDLETALVQVRRLNNKLYLYKTEAKRDYEQNPFAYYLGAVIWEADRKYDEAYIFYKKAYELIPDFPLLQEDLIRGAMKAQRPEEVARWRKLWPQTPISPVWSDSTMGELVVIYQQGWGPRKRPRPENHRFPQLVPTRSQTQSAEFQIVRDEVATPTAQAAKLKLPASTLQVSPPTLSVSARRLFSVQEVAIKTLESQYAALIAKRVAGIATKAVVSDQIRQKNELLGQLAWIALSLTDRADLRQWSTLPESFQIARVYLKPGTYTVTGRGLSGSGEATGEDMASQKVVIAPGRKAFVTWRSFH